MVTAGQAFDEVEREGSMFSKLGVANRLAHESVSLGTSESGLRINAVPAEPSVFVTPRRAWYLPIKVAVEWVLALALVLLAAPLMLVLAVLVKVTSPGPAFYSQTRLGRHGRLYKIVKLRTMRHNAEAQTGPVWAAKNDQRITAIGKILRSTHLDELPQLINVLRGEMSLIGPRPERPEIARRIQRDLPEFRQRLAMRPGITGLAQMNLPADDPYDSQLTGVRKKLAQDLFYAREVSFLLDLRIALSTPCYFIAAAIDAVRYGLVRSYGVTAEEKVDLAGAAGDNELGLAGESEAAVAQLQQA